MTATPTERATLLLTALRDSMGGPEDYRKFAAILENQKAFARLTKDFRSSLEEAIDGQIIKSPPPSLILVRPLTRYS